MCCNCHFSGIRMFAEDEMLRQTIDNFIQNNIKAVTESKKFYGLPQIPVEITGTLLEKDIFKLLLGNGNFTILLETSQHVNIRVILFSIEELSKQL